MDMQIIRRLQASPVAFRDALKIDDSGRPWRRDAWQEEFFRATDAGWQRAIGLPATGGYSRAWSVRPRGHSKTTDAAVMIVYALFAAQRCVNGVVGAADSDQARLILAAAQRLLSFNPWLGAYIKVERNRIVNKHTGSEAVVVSSDAATSWGLLVDFIIADELTVWKSRDLWDSLFSAAAKKATCFLAVLGNAGWLDSWQHSLWTVLETDPAWFVQTLPGPVASWISQAALAEQRRILAPVVYARVWLNVWTLNESGAIPPEQLSRSIVLPGPMPCRLDIESGLVAGVDLAVKRDKSGLCVLNFDPHGMVYLARAKSWHPSQFADRQIPQSEVEEAIVDAHRDFHLEAVVFDPASGGYSMMQSLSRRGIRCIAFPFTVANCDLLARSLLTAFAESRVKLFDHAELIADLGKLQLAELPTGWRLRAPRSNSGHCDLGVSFCIALAHAMVWGVQLQEGFLYADRLPENHPLLRARENERRYIPTIVV